MDFAHYFPDVPAGLRPERLALYLSPKFPELSLHVLLFVPGESVVLGSESAGVTLLDESRSLVSFLAAQQADWLAREDIEASEKVASADLELLLSANIEALCLIRFRTLLFGAVCVQSARVAPDSKPAVELKSVCQVAAILCDAHMGGDARRAAKLQQKLNPAFDVVQNGLSLSYRSLPAVAVGGDFSGFAGSPSRFGFALGDVAGHGTSAALAVSYLKPLIERVLRQSEGELSSRVSWLNEAFHHVFEGTSYFTLFCGEVNLRNGALTYLNAGHPEPFWLRNSVLLGDSRLATGGVPVGLFRRPPKPFECETIQLSVGETIVVISDGIIEAETEEETLVLEKDLEKKLRGARTRPAHTICREVLEHSAMRASQFTSWDDRSVMTLKL